jgi:hypothetical protein
MQAVLPTINNPVVAAITLTDHKAPAGFTVGAAGSTVAVTVTPETIATNLSYLPGDAVVLSEVGANGGSTKLAWGAVASVAGNIVTVTVIARNAAAITTPLFSTTAEITGSTRLTPPTWATKAFLTVVVTPALDAIADSTADPYKQVADNLRNGVSPLMYGGVGIDLNDRFGVSFRDTASLEIIGKAQLADFRLISAMPYAKPSLVQITATYSEVV